MDSQLCVRHDNKPVAVRNFLTDGGGIVSIATHPVDGELYYVTWTNGIKRIRYGVTANRPPVSVANADKTLGQLSHRPVQRQRTRPTRKDSRSPFDGTSEMARPSALKRTLLTLSMRPQAFNSVHCDPHRHRPLQLPTKQLCSSRQTTRRPRSLSQVQPMECSIRCPPKRPTH